MGQTSWAEEGIVGAGGAVAIYITLRRNATQLWPQQCRHRVQHYDPEMIYSWFWRAARIAALGIEGFDGASGCCGIERRCDV